MVRTGAAPLAAAARTLGADSAPRYNPPTNAKSKSGCASFSLGAIVAVLLLLGGCGAVVAIVAANMEDEPELVDPVSGNTADTPGANEGSNTFAVGDLIELGDWRLQVHGVAPVESTNQFLTPAPGTRWVGVDVEVVNEGSETAHVSSILCFTIQDSTNRSYQQTLANAGGAAPPDGAIPAGGAKRGTIVYEVPLDATGLQLHFNCDLFGTGVAVVNLGV